MIKKDVLITIKGTQTVDGEKDTTELFTQGIFYKKDGCFYITYDESETTGFAGNKTTLKVDGNEKVIFMRGPATRSHLIVEKGKRNIGHYGTEAGDVAIGVSTKEIDSKLCENGGELYFSYSLDINQTYVSDNEVYINIKDSN